MSNKNKKPSELILQVDAEDLERARSIITEATQKARKSWIPERLIAGALYLELQTILKNFEQSDEIDELSPPQDPDKSVNSTQQVHWLLI